MKIALLGYGKMGKTIDSIVAKKGKHQVLLRINSKNTATLTDTALQECDVAIEFSNPEAAFNNIKRCIALNVPIVVGTTAWLNKLQLVEKLCEQYNTKVLYASNFSIGVNLFFKLNAFLAQLMANYPAYAASMEEIHHTQKKDAPSGTAISLAQQLLAILPTYKHWANQAATTTGILPIVSKRLEDVKGTHTISYTSTIDSIQITHQAYSRAGFAQGALMAAEWLLKQAAAGLYTMNDVLQ